MFSFCHTVIPETSLIIIILYSCSLATVENQHLMLCYEIAMATAGFLGDVKSGIWG